MAAHPADLSPVTLELIKGALQSARTEMETLIGRTAMSPFIREKKDYFTAVLDASGRLVVSTAVTLAGNLVDAILEHYPASTMRDGDLYWFNDVYASRGAVTQTNDTVFVMPVFAEGRLIAFVEAWGHLWDVGGTYPGSVSPNVTSVFHEGIMIPPVRVMRDGVVNEEVVRIYERNSRFPETMRGDLSAIMAAVRLGKARLEEIVGRFGAASVERAFAAMLRQNEIALKQRIAATVPVGRWRFRDWIDSDAITDTSYFVETEVSHDGSGGLDFDFSGSADQATGPINYVMDDTVLGHLLGLSMLRDDPAIGMNAGFNRAVGKVVKRPGSIVAPNFPAPVGLRSHTMLRVTSSISGALAQATGGKSAAGSAVYVLYYLRGQDPKTGKMTLGIEGLSVGFGGRPEADGHDAIYYVAQENYPIEFVEIEFGVRIEAFGIHRDSGGAGLHRGGCGTIRDVRILIDGTTLGVRMDNCKYPAFGVNGGKSGATGAFIVNPGTANERRLPTMSDGHKLQAGDLLRIVTPGGGGWGAPMDRPAERVLADVLDGFTSHDKARDEYGVVFKSGGREVDVEATAALRASMTRPAKMYHRGCYFDAEERL
jgi:N-methylhydantoinase B